MTLSEHLPTETKITQSHNGTYTIELNQYIKNERGAIIGINQEWIYDIPNAVYAELMAQSHIQDITHYSLNT